MSKDCCVQCKKETQFDITTHIDERGPTYISGLGQLCYDCYKSIYLEYEDVKNDSQSISISKDTVLNTPNDMDLGAKIRNLFYESNTRIQSSR